MHCPRHSHEPVQGMFDLRHPHCLVAHLVKHAQLTRLMHDSGMRVEVMGTACTFSSTTFRTHSVGSGIVGFGSTALSQIIAWRCALMMWCFTASVVDGKNPGLTHFLNSAVSELNSQDVISLFTWMYLGFLLVPAFMCISLLIVAQCATSMRRTSVSGHQTTTFGDCVCAQWSTRQVSASSWVLVTICVSRSGLLRRTIVPP